MPGGPAGPIFTIFGACGHRHTADVITQAKFQVDWSKVWGLRVPKIGCFPLTLIVALTTLLRTTMIHCDHHAAVNILTTVSDFMFVI